MSDLSNELINYTKSKKLSYRKTSALISVFLLIETTVFITVVLFINVKFGLIALIAIPFVILVWYSLRALDRVVLDLFSPEIIYPFATVIYFLIGTPNLISGYVEGTLTVNALKIANVVLVGLISYYLGLFIAKRCFRLTAIKPGFYSSWGNSRLWLTILILFLFGLFGTLYGFSKAGAPLFSQGEGERLRHAYDLEAGGWVSLAHLSLQMVGVFSVFSFVRNRRAKWYYYFFCGLFFLGALLLLIAMMIRSYLVVMVVACIIIIHYVYRPFKIREIASAFFALFIFVAVFAYLRIINQSVGYDLYLARVSSLGFPSELLPLAPIYLSFRVGVENLYIILTRIPDQIDYFYGKLFLQTVSFIWVRHQVLPARLLASVVYGLDFRVTGPVAATTLGTFWAEGGLIGVVVGMFSLGAGLGTIYNRKYKNPTWLISYAIFTSFCLVYIYGTFFGDPTMMEWFVVLLGIGTFSRLKLRFSTAH